MRVLLIDDDALVRQTLADSLAEESIEVDGLADAEDALVLLSAGQVPDVLVTDIDLGAGLSGLDLASIAHERHPAPSRSC
jgi:DNA-binding NtrC family response regulator